MSLRSDPVPQCSATQLSYAEVLLIFLTGVYLISKFQPSDSVIHIHILFQILFHYRASLVAQLVKNLPAMRETWVPSLG